MLKKLLFIIIIIGFWSTSCKINYSFTGASISPEVKTVSVQYFPNMARLVNPNLSQVFTESLKELFLSQTNLNLVNNVGDLNFEGEITYYDTKPIAIQGNETAALNRLTIKIKVRFSNALDPEKDFATTFSRYADYESSKNLNDVEEDLVLEIIEQINDDIFNKSVANW
ncbi:MAG: LptE family protein [Chlorobi bacterium]|nr:LptE family protein [Chlorobiota bacterium]